MATYQQISQLIDDNLPTNGTPLISAEVHRIVEKAILDFTRDQWLIGDVKEIDCTNDYIAENFTDTGFGINERAGWAICNGLNGTRNRIGRVPIGYGGIGAYGANRDPLLVASTKTFTSIGDINNPVVGGLKDAVVVSHNHGITSGALKTGGPYGLKYASEFKFDSNYTTESTGESGTDKNLQPYIVTLFIQKISNP
jgi:hypothetical protein